MPRKQKPPISEWIVSERKRLGWKPADVSERLKAAGYEAEESTVQVWEAGRSPSADNIEGLERLFGSSAPREQADQSDLVAVIRELVEEVRLSRQASDRNADVLAQLLGVVLSGRLPQPETEGAADAPAPVGSPRN